MRKYQAVVYLLFFCCSFLCLKAQESTNIYGSVSDDRQPLAAASVLLYSAKDSSLVLTAVTGQDGKFYFTATPGSYFIITSFTGHLEDTSATFQLNANEKYQVSPIVLKVNATILGNVSITARKPIVERKADKLIFNVESAPSAAGLNALELLRKAPGVSVDFNDNISLGGKGNVLVMIDGKQVYLSGPELAGLLKSMQSNQIESIEIINNPGAKYEANSKGGIINIKTKKSKTEGFNGSVALGGGFNKYLMTDNSVNLNYRRKHFNVFGSYGYSRRKDIESLELTRIVESSGNSQYFSQSQKDTMLNVSHNFEIGTDFFLSNTHTLGFLIKSNINDEDQWGHSFINIGHSFNAADSVLETPSTYNVNRKNYTYNINYKGLLDSAGQELSFDVDYSKFNGKRDGSYLNRFYLPNGSFFKNGAYYRNFAPSTINIKAVKVDYVLPLNKKIKLSAGVKISHVESDNNYIYENNIGGIWQYDPAKSNLFLYDEKVNAAYSALQIMLGKSSIQGGLRIENTQSNGYSVTTNKQTERKYTDFFPSFIWSRQFDKNNVLNVSYSRKINRPNYQNLNPFEFYLDQYTYQQGNPLLNPEYSNNVELGYTFRQSYNLSLGYTYTTDVINQVLLQDTITKSIHQTYMNLASDKIISATLNFPVTITNWWSLNTNLLGYYRHVKMPDLNGASLNSKQYSGNFYVQNSFRFNNLTSADVSVVYSTPQIEGAYKVKSIFSADAGLRYNLPSQNGNLKLGVSDIFHTQKARVLSTLAGNYYYVKQYSTTTRVKLTFTYNFGKKTVKSARKRSTGLESEIKRLK